MPVSGLKPKAKLKKVYVDYAVNLQAGNGFVSTPAKFSWGFFFHRISTIFFKANWPTWRFIPYTRDSLAIYPFSLGIFFKFCFPSLLLNNLNFDLKISTQEFLKIHSLSKSLCREISEQKSLWREISEKNLPEESLKNNLFKRYPYQKSPQEKSIQKIPKRIKRNLLPKGLWGEIYTKESWTTSSLPKAFWKENYTQKIPPYVVLNISTKDYLQIIYQKMP